MMLELAAVLWLAAPPPAPVEPDASPSVDLLAFLGSFEDDDGLWVDPLALEAVAAQALAADTDDEAKHADEPIDTDRRAGADDH